MTNNGDLFVWGRNKENLLGIGKKKKYFTEPVRVSCSFTHWFIVSSRVDLRRRRSR